MAMTSLENIFRLVYYCGFITISFAQRDKKNQIQALPTYEVYSFE